MKLACVVSSYFARFQTCHTPFSDHKWSLEQEFVPHLDASLISLSLWLEHPEAVFARPKHNLKAGGACRGVTDRQVFQTEEESGRKCLRLLFVLEVEAGSLCSVVQLEVGIRLSKLGQLFFLSLCFELLVRKLSCMSHVLQAILAAARSASKNNDVLFFWRN